MSRSVALALGFFACLLGLALAATAGASTYVVRPDGSGDFPTIQAAINAASEGDVIELTDGRFTGSGNRDLIVDRPLTIRAQSGPGGACIIDCEASSSNRHRGMAIDDQAYGTLLEGITIQNAWVFGSGGAIEATETELTIDRCIFWNNYAESDGGAIYAPIGCLLTISGSFFAANRVNQYGRGGAIFLDDGTEAELTRCKFQANHGDDAGGIYCSYSHLTLTNCTINATVGPAILLAGQATLTAANTIISFGEDEAVYCQSGGTASFTCSDIFGNAGGDWTGCLAGQHGFNGNISLDPLYCQVPGEPPLGLAENSPCAPSSFPNTECDLIGAEPVSCGPHVYTVRADGTGDFPTIQIALDEAWYGSIVELEDGTYTGDGNRDVVFPNKPVTLRSASGDAHVCVIDGQGSAADPHRAFLFNQGNLDWCIVENIGMRNGHLEPPEYYGAAVDIEANCRPIMRGCEFMNNTGAHTGGGVSVQGLGAAPIFEDCAFSSNQATDGAALASWTNTQITVRRCTFSHNTGTLDGAVILYNATGTFEQCSFLQNEAGFSGAGVSLITSHADFTNCTFSGNSVGENGGGVYVLGQDTSTFIDCVFFGNSAGGSGDKGGGGVGIEYSHAEFTRCRFLGNSSPVNGAGAGCWMSGTADFDQCTFADNTTPAQGGAVDADDSQVVLAGCTLHHNAGGQGAGGIQLRGTSTANVANTIISGGYAGPAIECDPSGPAITLACTDIHGNAGGDWIDCIADQAGQNGNFCADPLFCLDENPSEPYTLHGDSPCAAGNNPECGQVGAWPVGCASTLPADVLLIEIGDTAVHQALQELSVNFDLWTSTDFSGLELSGYEHVFLALDGGQVDESSIANIADYAAAGGHLHIYGGTDYAPYAIALNAHLLQNDIGNHAWTILTQYPHVRIVSIGSYLSRSQRYECSYHNWDATAYQTRPTDPAMMVAAVNSDQVPILVTKSIGAGTLDVCTTRPSAELYTDPHDYSWLYLIVWNMHDMTPGGVVFQPIQDVYTTSFMPDGNFGGNASLAAGSTDEFDVGYWRSYLQFDMAAAQGEQIASASFWLDQYDTGQGQPGSPCSVHRVTEPWDEFTITWANQAAHASTVVDVQTVGASGQSGFIVWDVASLVQEWANGTPDHGLVVRHQTETSQGGFGHGWFRSMDSAVQYLPRIIVTVSQTSAVPGPAPASNLAGLQLSAPRPNPSPGVVTLDLSRRAGDPIRAEVLDVQGRTIRGLRVPDAAGWAQIRWDGRLENGAPVPAGSYYVRVRAGDETRTQRVVLVR